MHYETEQIVNAIKSLKQEGNLFKDYLFPIASAFFSSILGFGIAYKLFFYQNSVLFEKDKMNAINKFTLLAEEARATLIAIKQNYHDKLTSNPIQRATKIPEILFRTNPIVEDYSKLFFLSPKKLNNEYPKWSSIPLIRNMISNYNYLQDLWLQRNEIDSLIREKVLHTYCGRAYTEISLEDIIDCVGEAEAVKWIDITEQVIQFTDDLIVEISDFMMNFPMFAKKLVNLKKLKNYGTILTCSDSGNDYLLYMQNKSPVADYTSVLNLFGLTIEQMNKRYSTGYEEALRKSEK